MAELKPPGSRRCNYFFLYDGSKVRGEGDPTRVGICYFYPEETPLDKQELLCGQLAGVGRCVSELSTSPVRTLRLRHSKFAICMKDDFFWALGCSVEVPTVSVCEFLDQLINLFCFYYGSVRRSYEMHSKETLAAQWAYYLSHLQSGPSELYNTFSSLRTIDSTNIDPLLLLKAALILQACQRCPLVLAGCILFRGRLVSTQMPPELTMKVMAHENETYTKAHKSNGPMTSSLFSEAVTSTNVFLTASELQYLQSVPVNKDYSSHSTPTKEAAPKKNRLSRTLSDTPSTESEPSDPSSSHSLRKTSFSPHFSESDSSIFSPSLSQKTSDSPDPSNGSVSHEEDSYYFSFHNSKIQSEADGSTSPHLNGDEGRGSMADCVRPDFGKEPAHDKKTRDDGLCCRSAKNQKAEANDIPPFIGICDSSDGSGLDAMTLYTHRVNSLVLALLVEPHLMSDKASTEEVYHSSLASLNGLEAHLRSVSPVPPAAPGPYTFAHYDCVQRTLTTNVSGRPGGAPERPFVRATSLLHSHFCNTETLQEAIIRSASTAVYGTRSAAQETYFQQHGGTVRNSGIPNHQDSAFSLPGKARHRLLKHGVNLL